MRLEYFEIHSSVLIFGFVTLIATVGLILGRAFWLKADGTGLSIKADSEVPVDQQSKTSKTSRRKRQPQQKSD